MDNGLHQADVNDYNHNNFTTLQTRFLNSSKASLNENKYAIRPNGDWLKQESGEENSDNIILIKTPVISTIINRLNTVEDDTDLINIINYIDGKITKTELDNFGDFSQTDIEIVREARNTIYSRSPNLYAFSPVYCNAKDLVKKFLLYMASNEGIEDYADTVKGGFYLLYITMKIITVTRTIFSIQFYLF
jgi:hypothetical protein